MMPNQENPGVIGFVITALGLLSVILVIAGAAMPNWVVVPGSDSVVKTETKFLEATNTTIDAMQLGWPTMQAQYDETAALIPGLMEQITQMETLIASNPNSPPPGIVSGLELASAGLTAAYTGMGQLQALNATLNAVVVMDRLDTYGGFLSMCSFTPATDTFVCGSPSEFRDEELDITCEPDYVPVNQTVPTKDSILEETRSCNANGLAKAMMGGKMMFFILPIVLAVLLFIPIGIMGVMSFMPGKRGIPFRGSIVAGVFLTLGVFIVVLDVLFRVMIVGAYGKKGMANTTSGLSWILGLVGGIVAILAGVASCLVRPPAEVQPVS